MMTSTGDGFIFFTQLEGGKENSLLVMEMRGKERRKTHPFYHFPFAFYSTQVSLSFFG